MYKKILALLLFSHALAASALPLGSHSALVVDAADGRVLLEKNALKILPIASITKLMTAMVVLDKKQELDTMIRIEPEDHRHGSSRVPIGARLSLRAVLQLALMSSDNRAAAALARTYPGGLPAFRAAVRAKCRSLGMTDTVIEEPTGLSSRNRSTAADIARMAHAASKYPVIVRMTSDNHQDFKINGRAVTYRNTNRLVGREGWDIVISKTGTTRAAGRCLVMKLRSEGRKIIVVLLNAKANSIRIHDAEKLQRYIADWKKSSA